MGERCKLTRIVHICANSTECPDDSPTRCGWSEGNSRAENNEACHVCWREWIKSAKLKQEQEEEEKKMESPKVIKVSVNLAGYSTPNREEE